MAVLGPAPSIGHPGERPRCVGTDIWVRSSACPAPVVHTRHHRVVQRARQSPTSSAVLPSAAGWTTSTYGQVGLRPRPCQTGWTVSGITSTRPPWRESTVRLSGRRLVQCKPDHLFQGLGPDRRLRPAALAHLGEFRRPSAANRCRHCPHAGWSPPARWRRSGSLPIGRHQQPELGPPRDGAPSRTAPAPPRRRADGPTSPLCPRLDPCYRV